MKLNELIGIPWIQGGNKLSGCDCWGLVVLTMKHIYKIDIEKHIGAKHEGEELAQVIDDESNEPDWVKIDGQVCAGDVAVVHVRGTGRPEHVGVYIGGGNILHSPGGAQRGVSCITSEKVMLRVYKKIEYFRHAKLQNCHP